MVTQGLFAQRLKPIIALAVLLVATTRCPAEPVDFDTEVIPVLTRHGCNAGSCHGAAIGRGGFKLSLLGSGAAADFDTIRHQLEGRRINLADPDLSLLLRKPSEQTGHEGGHVLPEDSTGFNILRRWISEGARRLQRRHLVRLEVHPSDAMLPANDAEIPFSVKATFDDGTSQDVTDQTVLVANDPDAVQIDPAQRRLTVRRRGVHVVIARFLDQVLPMRLTIPLQDQDLSASDYQTLNPIDQFVNQQLERLHLAASPLTDDFAFLRRLTLDLAGRLPTPAELVRFADDPTPDKRKRVIDQMLDSEEFAVYWTLKWANVLQVDSKSLQPEGAEAYHTWLREQLRRDVPIDEMARQMLTAEGDSFVHGEANFLRSGSSPGELAEHVTRVLMGVRLRCANCHNHPLDHWQQDDYHGLAAIFAKLNRGRVVSASERGEVTHPVTGEPAVPRIPGERDVDEDADGRAEFAAWLATADKLYLPKVTVNRLWQQLLGRGLVDPVDDLRVTNPASHPELLDWLANDFVENGYHLKHTIALICNSAAYQRDSSPIHGNESDSTFYSHALHRPLEAEVIADAIGDVTGIALPSGSADRVVAMFDNRFESISLDILGRCDRTESCEASASSASSATSLAQALHLINGPLLNERLADEGGRLKGILDEQPDDKKVIEALYLRTLSRPPTIAEERYWASQLESVSTTGPSGSAREEIRRPFFEDLLWSLLTSKSFLTNH